MNWMLVKYWNETVSPEDTVYHLGDVAFQRNQKAKEIEEIVRSLNGTIYLVPGNHDYPNPQRYEEMGMVLLAPYIELKTQGYTLELGHGPPDNMDATGRIRGNDKRDTVDFYLCGHVHTAFRRKGNVINVGVDVWNYRPVTLEQLLEAEDELGPPINYDDITNERLNKLKNA